METLTIKNLRQPRTILALVAFLALVIGVGAFIGTQTAPGAWYASLEKPPFNPPNWVFGPVWFLLYAMIAVAGWRIFLLAPKGPAMVLWATQMLLNWAWSPVFFTAQDLWLALAVIIPMLGIILAFIAVTRRMDRLASWLFVPYAAWVGFATILNLSLAVLN